MSNLSRFILILTFIAFTTGGFAQLNSKGIRGHLLSDSSNNTRKWARQSFLKTITVPASFIGLGLISMNGYKTRDSYNDRIKEKRDETIPDFHTKSDDYIQYIPLGSVYLLNAIKGVKSKNNFANRTAMLLKAELIVFTIVHTLKETTGIMRPDGSSQNSFPSGHTAFAFVAAAFVQNEYGHISPFYSIGAYTLASAVGVLRVLNNRHWVSDVLSGAGIGILSAKISYLTHQYIWGRNKRKKDGLKITPLYAKKAFGLSFNFTF